MLPTLKRSGEEVRQEGDWDRILHLSSHRDVMMEKGVDKTHGSRGPWSVERVFRLSGGLTLRGTLSIVDVWPTEDKAFVRDVIGRMLRLAKLNTLEKNIRSVVVWDQGWLGSESPPTPTTQAHRGSFPNTIPPSSSNY